MPLNKETKPNQSSRQAVKIMQSFMVLIIGCRFEFHEVISIFVVLHQTKFKFGND